MEAIHPGEMVQAGELELRPAEHLVTARGRVLCLSVRELDLLVALARRDGKIVSRQELYELVWSRPFTRAERSVDVYVAKLRAKLEVELPEWRFIHTHVGFGYRFSAEPLHHLHTTATPR